MSSFMQDTRDPEEDLGLLELLGEGSYGAVYRAERRTDGMEVAVKIIPADNPADLLKEVDIMLACVSPYIVRLHDCYYKDNEAWLVMDFVGGGSVSDILEACEVTLSEPEARECAAWTVLSLDYLHSNRKLHRDVKAGNILLTLDGRAKLADFGVSKEVSTMANKAQTAIGTPYWMAPEVIQEVPYDGQADIWSLAITCIEMVEGNPPLNNVHPMRAIFMIPSKPSPTLSEPAKWSLEFNDFVARCLEKKPEDRPSSRALLRHPWIAASVGAIQQCGGHQGSAIIRDLVAEHLPVLTSFREDASDAKAAQIGAEPEDSSGYNAATLRRMSSTRGSGTLRGYGTLDARSPGTASLGKAGALGEAGAHARATEREDGCDDDSGDEGSLTSDGSVIRVPIRGHNHATREDSYSSGGSVMRVAIGGTAGEEDGYSSGGSVVRVPIGGYADEEGGTSSRLHKGYYSAGADACAGDDAEGGGYSSDGSVIRVPIGSIEDDNYSSDGSVVRVPVTKESMHPSAAHVRGRKGGGEGTPEPQAGNAEGQVLLQQRALEPQGGKQVDAEQSPANAMKMNLQAAARYFANKGGPVELTSHKVGGSKGAEGGQINGSPPALELAEQPPQAKMLLDELEKLDVAFANDLSRIRQTYDKRKAALQAELRVCLDGQLGAAPV